MSPFFLFLKSFPTTFQCRLLSKAPLITKGCAWAGKTREIFGWLGLLKTLSILLSSDDLSVAQPGLFFGPRLENTLH